ncbi:hypothetical protein [Donghicola mangrovi]|uniref:Uncharacterized protein n=1 Tax=Donghicola mangrovi TaxID=2729614 RepID=A0A850QFH8_9RHOB|nr:hypothetical protein [Donghicola mangrovi]NVO25720.1 hypothetical protein [Donghicola mangrovi]
MPHPVDLGLRLDQPVKSADQRWARRINVPEIPALALPVHLDLPQLMREHPFETQHNRVLLDL